MELSCGVHSVCPRYFTTHGTRLLLEASYREGAVWLASPPGWALASNRCLSGPAPDTAEAAEVICHPHSLLSTLLNAISFCFSL